MILPSSATMMVFVVLEIKCFFVKQQRNHGTTCGEINKALGHAFYVLF